MSNTHGAALARSLVADLLTDWVPDAIGATDVLWMLRRGELPPSAPIVAPRLMVALPSHSDEVPVVDVVLRGRFHCLVDDALTGRAPHPNVFGYRSLRADYRAAYRARTQRLRALAAEGSLILSADVHRFSASLPLSSIVRQSWMTPALAEALAELEDRAGRCLLPGHLWANRIAAAVLAPVDEALAAAVGPKWVRWADDIHVCVHDSGEADSVRELLESELGQLGLQLSESKTQLISSEAILDGPARDVGGDATNAWRRGVATDDIRSMRYALPRLASGLNMSALDDLNVVTARHPSLMPRAVAYLDRFVDTRAGTHVARELLARETSPAAIGRLLALVARHPVLLPMVPERSIRTAQSSDILGLRALAWRAILQEKNAVGSAPSQRLSHWARNARRVSAQQPRVDTLL